MSEDARLTAIPRWSIWGDNDNCRAIEADGDWVKYSDVADLVASHAGPAGGTMTIEQCCERIEHVRNQIDLIFASGIKDRRHWNQLNELDNELRELKREMGFPNAGLTSEGNRKPAPR